MGNENSAPKKEGDPDILEAIGLGWIAPKEEGQHVSSQGKSSDNRSAGNHSHIQQFHHDVIPGRIPMGQPREIDDSRRESWVGDLPGFSSNDSISSKSGRRGRSVSREGGKEEYIRNELGVIVGKRSSRQSSPARSKEGSRSSSKSRSRQTSPGLDPNLGAVHFAGGGFSRTSSSSSYAGSRDGSPSRAKRMEKVVSRLQEVLGGDIGDSLVLTSLARDKPVRVK